MTDKQERAPLFEQLYTFVDHAHASFHIPGHKHGRGMESSFPLLSHVLPYDLTELPGLDDLHHAEGVILEAQELAAEWYGAEETFFLVNGSTVGNLALVLTVCEPGDLILVQRNVHQSILHGLMLAGVQAVFLSPEWDSDSGTSLGVELSVVQRAIALHPQAKAVFVSNPSYYGAAQELSAMAGAVHEAGMALLVDEAHGAHFGFHAAWPGSALQSGADGVVQSSHKMLSATTMSAMLHVQGPRINRLRLRQCLKMLQSSSPSYLLMASLDLARRRLSELTPAGFDQLLLYIHDFHQSVQSNQQIRVLSACSTPDQANYRQDPCKLLVRVSGYSGFELQQQLAKQGCMVELADQQQVLVVLSLESTRRDFERLSAALLVIASNSDALFLPQKNYHSTTNPVLDGILDIEISQPIWYSLAMLPGPSKQIREVSLHQSIGKANCLPITPYPPGIPLLQPGERIDVRVIDFLQRWLSNGGRVHGVIHQADTWLIRVFADAND